MRIGTIARIYRYPVKSMAGEELIQTAVGFQGVPGDRRYAFVQAETRSPFPWLTAREVAEMLCYRPGFEDQYTGTGSEPSPLVTTPDGRRLRVDDGALKADLEQKLGKPLFLMRDYRGNYDVAAISIISLAAVAEIGKSAGRVLDPRRFRANFYLEPEPGSPVPEAEWVGKVLAIGPDLRLAVTEQDERCVMINLDPDSAAGDPVVLKTVATEYGNRAGVYAVVLRPGIVNTGDGVEVVGQV
jgi:uncharacterized protein YcbX